MTLRSIAKKVYSRDNHIFFLSDINKSSIYLLENELHKTYVNNKKAECLYLHLNTDGGCLRSAFAGVTFIENIPIDVNTIIEGNCASSDTVLSVIGKKRFMSPYARVMIHQISGSMEGTYEQLLQEAQSYDMDTKELIDYYNKYTCMSRKQLQEQLKKDQWWDASVAITNGFIDDIWKVKNNSMGYYL